MGLSSGQADRRGGAVRSEPAGRGAARAAVAGVLRQFQDLMIVIPSWRPVTGCPRTAAVEQKRW